MELRDQGFTRPKVLILLPTRQACVRMVDTICSLALPTQQHNRKLFSQDFGGDKATFSASKPADFRALFDGNQDDNFRVAVRFTRKAIKYFAKMYDADLILASPLGMKLVLGGAKDDDFLSSIEMLVVDHADALLMQNWEHIDFILERLNQRPKKLNETDFSRVRMWSLEDQAPYFRQTVLLSAFNSWNLQYMWDKNCLNWAGGTLVQPLYSGVIHSMSIKVKQTFSRLDCKSAEEVPEKRMTHFTTTVLPNLVKYGAEDAKGTLVLFPDSMEYRLFALRAKSNPPVDLSFGSLWEYSEVREASRARSHFASGRTDVLLYTERAHHFFRYNLRGVRRVIMYGLPDNPIFYKEIVQGYLGASYRDGTWPRGFGTVTVLFSKWDAMKLDRIVGMQTRQKMLSDARDTFEVDLE